MHWQPCRRRYSSDQSQCSRVLCNAVPSERDTKIIKACTSQIQGNDQGPSQVCNPSRQANADPSITLQAGQSKRFQCSNLRRPCLSHRETSNHQSNTLWQKANHINHPSTNQARSSCLNALLAAIKVQRQSCSHMLKQRQQRSPMLHASKIRHRKRTLSNNLPNPSFAGDITRSQPIRASEAFAYQWLSCPSSLRFVSRAASPR